MHYLKRSSERRVRWLRLRGRLLDAKWWLYYRLHPSHRSYHIVKLGPPGWYDRNEAVLLACFSLLDDFLTKEPIEMIDWNAQPDTAKAIREMRSLHFWWKHQREQEKKECIDLFSRIWDDCRRGEADPWDDPNDPMVGINPQFRKMDQHPLWPEYSNLSDYVETISQKQLKRLVEIREFMWT